MGRTQTSLRTSWLTVHKHTHKRVQKSTEASSGMVITVTAVTKKRLENTSSGYCGKKSTLRKHNSFRSDGGPDVLL